MPSVVSGRPTEHPNPQMRMKEPIFLVGYSIRRKHREDHETMRHNEMAWLFSAHCDTFRLGRQYELSISRLRLRI